MITSKFGPGWDGDVDPIVRLPFSSDRVGPCRARRKQNHGYHKPGQIAFHLLPPDVCELELSGFARPTPATSADAQARLGAMGYR